MLHVITQQTWSHGTDGWSRTQGYWVIANLESNCWTVLTQSVRVHELHHTLARVSLVRECCNGDDESLWRTGKFDPSIQRPLNWSSPKFAYAIHYVRDSYQNAKVHPDWITGFVSAHARLCACVGYFFQFFSVLPIAYSKDAHIDFYAKYAERRGSAQGCAFWGSRNHCLKF